MPSTIDALNQAMTRTGKICFKPFKFGTWAAMALMAFLAGYSGGGFNPSGNFTGGGGKSSGHVGTSPMQEWHHFQTWFLDHSTTIFLVGGAILIFVLVFLVVFTWLGCHAKFVFMDNIVRKHGLISQPWKEYSPQSNSLLFYLMVFGPLFLLVYIAIVGIGVLIALPDFKAEEFTAHGIWAIVFVAATMLITMLINSIIGFVVYYFLVPIMYFYKVRMLDAYRIFRTKVLPGNIGQILLFALMKFVLGIGIALGGTIVGCCTCCIGFLPYISTFATLPLHVFSQAYDLYFVAGFFGEQFFVEDLGGFPVTHVGPDIKDNPTLPPPLPPQT